MSIVKQLQCDRCGARIDAMHSNYVIAPVDLVSDIDPEESWITIQISSGSAFSFNEVQHLCPNCIDDFRSFIANVTKTEFTPMPETMADANCIGREIQ